MKLSVSAYRAHASAHKKILDTAYQLNYGSTAAAAAAAQAAQQQSSTSAFQVGTTNRLMAHQQDEGSSDDAITPLHSPRSLNTSREEDDSSNANESDCKSPSQSGSSSIRFKEDCSSSEQYYQQQDRRQRRRRHDDHEEVEEQHAQNGNGAGTKAASQSWKNLKAVMAYYHSLRKIKRTKSNQRWMKLRTTVQISSAIQKKPPLKREDSFLKRFSSRQIPETQETVEDTGSEGGGGNGPHSDSAAHSHRRRRRLRKQPRTVVNPDENFYFYWLFILTLCVLYNMWTLIVRQSFPELQQLVSMFWFFCDSLSDFIFLMDVLVQLRTGYLEQGLMVYDSKKLACHYLRSRAFLLDVAALCPLDLLQFRLGPQPLLRCPRFFKVYRAVNYYYMVESRTVWPNLWRVINLIHILLILAHWFGCFYFLLSEAEGFQGDWVYPYRPGDYATLTRKYLGSLYWSTLTLTTIGDLPTPETNAEKTNSVDGPRSLPRRGIKSRLLQFNTNNGYVFTIVSYLIGVFIFATIVGQVGNVITNRNANRLEFERLLDGAKTYMRHHKVPGGMKRRVLRWYDYSWSRGRIQGGGDINTALGLLPDKLKTELALHVNLSVLKKVTIFQECQPEFLRDLVLKMKAYIFTPGDSICRKGEVAREMFIIADGILEVISEHGKVLTTMKAGDFFGEIGILNLDGLNKRTADVRSVGYSELFSLSREDVLAAMKDYPEAQEILQALGRKRLMEVKASAKQGPPHKEHHHRHHHHGHSHHQDPKGLVDKIKNEAKGLRNVLKKSRTGHHKSFNDDDESLELQPLHTTSNNKGALKRMSRVKSHDLSQDGDEQQPQVVATPPKKVMSPLGAGLPLLQRLRLLKEKQENEEHHRAKSVTPPSVSSPPAAAGIKSPAAGEAAIEPIGAGLPLLQRILMLKAKEDRAKLATAAGAAKPMSPTPAAVPSAGGGGGSKQALQKFRDRIKFHSTTPLSDVKEPSNSDSSNNVSTSIEATQVSGGSSKDGKDSAISTISSKKTTTAAPEAPWIKLKKAAISRDSCETTTLSPTSATANVSSSPCTIIPSKSSDTMSSLSESKTSVVSRPKLVFTSKTKHYRSIDDLSPEYGGLPFVKKLKILNERQKLEELETVMKTRSFSLDIPDGKTYHPHSSSLLIDGTLVDTLTRSHSEGSTMHRSTGGGNNLLATPLVSSELHSSNESNETPERRRLRSILKKLSEDTIPATTTTSATTSSITTTTSVVTTTMPPKIDSGEFRKLMRAPTIEGYAARHSKLSKSVTFNRDTLQSPPNSAILLGTQQPNLFTFSSSMVEQILSPTTPPPGVPPTPPPFPEEIRRTDEEQPKATLKLIKTAAATGIDDEPQHYFAEILMAIKQVMNAHLQEMQEKFYQRFERLEHEIQSRDEIINCLRAHISQLEQNNTSTANNTEESISDSFETVIGRTASWEETSHEEAEEIEELAHRPIQPLHIWQQQSSANNEEIVLNIDSTASDTEESADDVTGSSAEQDDDEEDDGYENTSANWEIELLAAQMREKRSASLDHNITLGGGRPLRKRLTRGGSADGSRHD